MYLSLYLKDTPIVPVYNLEGKEISKIKLPPVFGMPIRKDLIKRAYLSAFTAKLQPKGRDPLAGKRTSARSFGIGLGIARVPRIPGIGRAAFINSAVGGHLAFPPTTRKKIHEQINKKEMKLAVMSALAATAYKDIVEMRGHITSNSTLPIIVVDDFEKIVKTREVKKILEKLNLWDDVERVAKRKRIRAGKGKMRGRRYKVGKSILVVISDYSSPVRHALRNLPGVDITTPDQLNILHLAPGGVPGRLTLFTLGALNKIAEKFEVSKP